MEDKDIRPPKMMDDKKPYIEIDLNFLKDNIHRWVNVNCPACNNEKFTIFCKKDGFSFFTCNDCNTVFMNPRPSQNLLHEFYEVSQNYIYWKNIIFPATEKIRRKNIFKPRAKMVADISKNAGFDGGTLLEVGSGYGLFCEEIEKTGCFKRIIAIEPTVDLSAHCKKLGFEVIQQPIEMLEDKNIADVIASFEVIEHLFCPNLFINKCKNLLNPKGLLILTCPNIFGFDIVQLGAKSHTINHEHLNYFNPDSIKLLLQNSGFKILEIKTPGVLDAAIVRNQALDGQIDLIREPFLKSILLDNWEKFGTKFQKFLSSNCMSSHMMVIAQKK